MPPLPGEERLVTVFADIHYYFTRPTPRPALDRFDKASYFYIYYNSTRHTSRVEVANSPGTPDQDAFNGYLDTCRVTNSYKFPTLVTFEVDGLSGGQSPTSPKKGRDPDEWRLPSGDQTDDKHSKYRIHTMDIYFWAAEDAKLVIDFLRKLLNPSQLDVADSNSPTNSAHEATTLSPVVQNLEHMAVSDPAYSNGQTRNSKGNAQAQSINLPPPPPLPTGQPIQSHRQAQSPSPVSDISHTQTASSIKTPPPPQSQHFVPMAYNPAAPAAPEPIAHREKTPPPEDGASGTGLSAAVMHDTGYRPGPPSATQAYTGIPGAPPNLQSHYGTPPPHHPVAGGYGSPPSTVGYSSPPPQQHFDPRSSYTSTAPSFAGPPVQSLQNDPHRHSTAAQTYIPSPDYQPEPVETPGTQFYSTLQSPAKPLQHIQPQYPDYLSAGGSPVQQQQQQQHHQHHHHHQQQQFQPQTQAPLGGYSSYSYSQPNASTSSQNTYGVHNEVYRPTESEAHKPSKSSRPSTSSSKPQSRFDQGAERVEKGVGRLFKKIEKRIG